MLALQCFSTHPLPEALANPNIKLTPSPTFEGSQILSGKVREANRVLADKQDLILLFLSSIPASLLYPYMRTIRIDSLSIS